MLDSHCHLTNARFDADRPAVLERMIAAGVTACVSVGTGPADAANALALTRAHPGIVHASAGLDPFSSHEAGDAFPQRLAELAALLRGGGFAALGEIGIECHHQVDSLPQQRARVAAQLALAAELDLPVILHARSGPHGGDAHAELRALVAAVPGLSGVLHSFDGDAAQARGWLDLGLHLGINGMATFKANDRLREAIRTIPADRLLVETDAPYLAPVPHRGRRCEPGHAADTLAFLADLRGERREDLDAWAERNARSLFRI
jgi:TatD DNase family protein